jgi:hypothetical protein
MFQYLTREDSLFMENLKIGTTFLSYDNDAHLTYLGKDEEYQDAPHTFNLIYFHDGSSTYLYYTSLGICVSFLQRNKNIKKVAIHKEIKDYVIIHSIRKTNLPTDIQRYIGTFLLEDYYTML